MGSKVMGSTNWRLTHIGCRRERVSLNSAERPFGIADGQFLCCRKTVRWFMKVIGHSLNMSFWRCNENVADS